MSFEQISYLAQIVASVGVVVSLIFVGLQVRQNTGALQRNEHNSTMAQWTVIRMAIAKNRDIAELMTDGLRGERSLDAADQLRLEQMLQENAWASFHIWERTQRGIFPKGTFELSCGAHTCAACFARRLGGPGGAAPNRPASPLGSSRMSMHSLPRRNRAVSSGFDAVRRTSSTEKEMHWRRRGNGRRSAEA
jgi:hypothetical protein